MSLLKKSNKSLKLIGEENVEVVNASFVPRKNC